MPVAMQCLLAAVAGVLAGIAVVRFINTRVDQAIRQHVEAALADPDDDADGTEDAQDKPACATSYGGNYATVRVLRTVRR